MYKVLRPDRDAYITDRVVKGDRKYNANVGAAGSLDLFKLYGMTLSGSNPNVELSRLLVHYDLQPLRDLVSAGRLDPNGASFSVTLKLFDVYGGQPTPANFTVAVHPLSRSFDEGLGRDVVYYGDRDVCSFLSGSRAQGAWLVSGCGLGGTVPGQVDYVSNLKSTQFFATGEEDLSIDVTQAVQEVLAGNVPDEGFRISLDAPLEGDNRTYFVKRFAARTAFNEDKHPRLIVKYDDSVQDDSLALLFDSPSSLFLYNYAANVPANLTSGSALTPITGSNSLFLKLATEISGGWYTIAFSGSQHVNDTKPVTGVYSASVTLSAFDPVFAAKLAQSGSVKLTPIWGSLDGTVPYLTGTAITIWPSSRGPTSLDPHRFIINVYNVQERYFGDEETTLRVHLLDTEPPTFFVATRLPVQRPGAVVRDVHYQVRDDVTGKIEIPFDTQENSTRLSSDATGMYFKLDMANLTKDRSYVIDVMVKTGGSRNVYKNASPIFRVSDMR